MIQSQGSGASGWLRLIRRQAARPPRDNDRCDGRAMTGLRSWCWSACLLLAAATPGAAGDAEDPQPPLPAPAAAADAELAGGSAGGSAGASSGSGVELDKAHDWLYRSLQHWIEAFDRQFARPDQEALAVPPSMLRFDLQGSLIHQRNGATLLGATDLEATVHLPNIERSLRLFITSEDLQESPGPLAEQPSGLRAGMRWLPASALSFELGVHARLIPSAFSA